MKKKVYVMVETREGWLFQDKDGCFLCETNMFGGAEEVELLKKDYFDLQAAEEVEKRFNVEVWLSFPGELELL